MVRPLEKLTGKGERYTRRASVEVEISELEDIALDELVKHCKLRPKTVSTEALLYFVRITPASSPSREQLFTELMRRTLAALPGAGSETGGSTGFSNLAIRDRVFDSFVDQILAEQTEYNEQLDYYEVNFNHALKADCADAKRQIWKEENRSEGLVNDQGEISAEVEEAAANYASLDADELDEDYYRRLLDGAIDTLPPIQRRILEMLRLDFPIASTNVDTPTISKALGKSEKTIRNQRDRAFATLRRRFERKEEIR
ncbi:RNA polymerase sigma factor [Pseudomonas sp. PI1]|uniref:RNA polymerase sigma factor n=1 Tax=Pseudomonas sp. PI1 TaxID=1582493 RepID=UPI0009E51E5D|nr:hypothetical protein [Pseudomonas sp. PI1]